LSYTPFQSTKSPDKSSKSYPHHLALGIGGDKNSNLLSALSCPDWKSNALQELNSLQAVKTHLESLSCAVTGVDGTTTDVVCQGMIIATDNNEDQDLDLTVRTYQVVQQGEKYLVRSYK
jgi:hypothetical protein